MQRSRKRYVFALAAAGVLLLPAVVLAADKQSSWGNEMEMMDTDADGRITAAEHAVGAKKMFETMDANKDGKVTAAEMDAGQTKMKGGPSHHGMSSAEKIKVVDRNGDGALSAEEHAAGAQDMFGKMDADRNNSITVAEVKAGHAKMMSPKAR